MELLQTAGKPDDGYRRKTALTAFSEAKAVPRDLGIADFFAIDFYDSAYPELLKHILYSPLVLFCLGDLAVLEQRSVALVGARKST